MIGSILRDIARLGWPVLVGQLAVMANGVIDTVMAGRLGANDLAAVGIGASVYFSVFATLMGVMIALSPVVAQLYGAKRYGEIGEEVRQSLWLGALLVAGAFLLTYFPDPFLALAQAPAEVEAKTRAYLRAIAWGLPAMMLFRVFYSLSTAVSRPRVVMMLNLGALLPKIPLNLVFMHGWLGAPEMGGPGCAVSSTVIAWAAALAALAVCRLDPGYRPYRLFAHWSWPRWREIRRLAQLGLPIGFNFLVDITSFTFMALFVARLGAASSSGHQIASNVTAVAYMLPLAMGNASGVLVGQAIGAGDHARARLTGIAGIATGLALGSALGLAIWLGRGTIAGLYSHDPAVEAMAATLLAWVALYHVLDAGSAISVSVLRGYKKTVVPMLCNIVALWGVGLAGGYLLAFGTSGTASPMGAPGFWIGAIVGVAIGGSAIVAYFLYVSAALSPSTRAA